MSSWFWPQYLFATSYVISFLGAVFKDLNTTDGSLRLHTVIWLITFPIYAYALHVGGFW